MKILKSLFQGAAAAITASPADVKEALVMKRNGTLVTRAVLNGDEWQAWGEKHGIPGMIAADQLAVTIFASATDIKTPCDTVPVIMSTSGYQPGTFVALGPTALAFSFSSYQLSDRNWTFASGVDFDYYYPTPTFRPHLTLTLDAGSYELPDEALQDVPQTIVLAGETVGPLTAADPTDADADGDDDDSGPVVVVVLQASVREAAAKCLASKADMDLFDVQAMTDIARDRKVTKSVLNRVAKRDWAPAEIKKAAREAGLEVATTRKTVERELTMTIGPLSTEMLKKAPKLADLTKAEPEQQLIWGIASVATIGGVDVVDLQGDTITTDAQRQWLHSLMKGQRGGKFDHEGDMVNEVVEGIVLCKSVQDVLGIDLGWEGILCCTHVPSVDDWAKVKEGSWMHSIAGTVLVEIEE